MRRFLLTVLLMTVAALTSLSSAAITAGEAFERLPDVMLDLLPKQTRTEMLIYFDNDSIWQAPNTLGGRSALTAVSDSFLSLRLTPVSTMQIKILPGKKEAPVVMVLYTIEADGEAGDTNVDFFSEDMKPLQRGKLMPEITLKELTDIPKGSDTSLPRLEKLVPFPTMVLEASPDNDDLTARLTVGKYMGRDEWKELQPYVAASARFVWDGKRFRFSPRK